MDKDLLDRNLTLLETCLPPGLADHLRNLTPAASLTGSIAGNDLNLSLNGSPLYQPDAVTVTRDQVQNYLKAPNRLLSRLGGLDPDATGICDRMLQDLLHANQGLELQANPEPGGAYLFIFGLGLGLSLNDLVRALDFRELVIIEESPELLRFAFGLFDWEPILSSLRYRKGEIHFIVPDSAEVVGNSLVHIIRGPNHSLVDGSYIFQGYSSPVLDQSIGKLAEIRPIIFGPKGFFEDEMTMIRNAAANMKLGPYGLLEDRTDRRIKNVPALIIGSGPSIDSQYETIKSWADRAVIFSGGTGLNGLLDHGIRPHFHCEVENTTDIYDGLKQTAARHDLSGIHLLAANTVDPRVPGLFDHVSYYFKDTISSTRTLAGSHPVMGLAGPSVTNLASRAALALGFPQHLLFGIDLGSREPDRHHADSSIYAQSDDPYWNTGTGIDPLEIPIPGARGGTIYTNGPFLLIRSFFEQLFLSFPQCQFLNLSDGATIAGTDACLPEELNLPPTEEDLSGLSQEIIKDLGRLGPDDFDLAVSFSAYFKACDTWLTDGGTGPVFL